MIRVVSVFFLLLFLSSCSSFRKRENGQLITPPSIHSKAVMIYEQTKANFGPCEPSIAINPKDPREIVVGSILNYVHRSKDRGKTWTTSTLSSPLGVFGDPCLVADPKGNFYYFHLGDPDGTGWSSNRFLESIVVQKSSNGGKTWSSGSAIGPNAPKQQDKEWAVVNPKNNNIHLSWTEFDKYGDKSPSCKSRIMFSTSIDQAGTWSEPVVISNNEGNCKDGDETPEGAVPAVDKNGNVYVSWAYNKQIYLDKSKDGGKTWMVNDQIIAEQSVGWDMNIPGLDRCNGMPVTAVDLSNGPNANTIYVVYADQKNGKDDTDIFIVSSRNQGKTWTQPINVFPNDNNKHQFLPWLAVDPRTGGVYIVFYDRSKYEDHSTDVVVAASKNGGMSFEYRTVSDAPFDPPGASTFFGDYNNIDALGGMIRPVWTSHKDGKLSVWTNLLYWP